MERKIPDSTSDDDDLVIVDNVSILSQSKVMAKYSPEEVLPVITEQLKIVLLVSIQMEV